MKTVLLALILFLACPLPVAALDLCIAAMTDDETIVGSWFLTTTTVTRRSDGRLLVDLQGTHLDGLWAASGTLALAADGTEAHLGIAQFPNADEPCLLQVGGTIQAETFSGPGQVILIEADAQGLFTTRSLLVTLILTFCGVP